MNNQNEYQNIGCYGNQRLLWQLKTGYFFKLQNLEKQVMFGSHYLKKCQFFFPQNKFLIYTKCCILRNYKQKL